VKAQAIPHPIIAHEDGLVEGTKKNAIGAPTNTQDAMSARRTLAVPVAIAIEIRIIAAMDAANLTAKTEVDESFRTSSALTQ
jgi:hypothetical protein